MKKRKLIRKSIAVSTMLFLFATNATVAFAETIADSAMGTGFRNLIDDSMGYVLIILPILVALAVAYFSARKNFAEDEQDGKMWSKRIKTSFICLVIGECSATLVKVFMSYFGG